ncbi:helix-turn-helix domain-containing protein [Nocardia grenadensis]|uniref:helix-turn-helix domain-containing protein n=1 Tax=Nocardia grenadensis TaxID=931537 RepID=UPI0007A3E681|nr:helix-turn-helix domain-containing protein [Nocardia grenadensis]
MGADEDARRNRPITEAAAILDGLVTQAEHERAHEHDGAMAEWLDALLAELRPIAEQIHDLAATQQLFGVVERHGPGPWPAEDLAAVAGVDPSTVQRVLDQLTAAGIARTEPGGREEHPGR